MHLGSGDITKSVQLAVFRVPWVNAAVSGGGPLGEALRGRGSQGQWWAEGARIFIVVSTARNRKGGLPWQPSG